MALPFGKGRLGGILLLLAIFVAACGPKLPTEPLEDVPRADLTTAEDAVRRQLTEAWSEIDTIASKEPAEQADAFGRLAGIHVAYDLLDVAAAAYRNAVRLAPEEPRWWYLLGVVYRWEGQLDEAATSLERALQLEGEDDTARLATLLQAAEVENDRGRPESAEDLARRALEVAEDEAAAAHKVLGAVAESRDDVQSAIAHYQAALDRQPEATRLHYLLGQAYRRAGDLELAREHLSQAGPVDVAFGDPRLASVYTAVLGSAALRQQGASAKSAGMLGASVEIYRQAVANDPQSPGARRDLGALLAQTGRFREAADQYREAVRLEPGAALSHFSLALVLEQVDEAKADEEALAAFQRAVELEPDYREFRRALADRLAQQGRFAEALPHFEHLVDGDPTDVEARLERAKVRAASGDGDGALADARRVADEAELPKSQAEALGVVGEVLSRKGDGPGAVTAFRRALEIRPDFAGAHFGLGNLLGVAGRYEDAAASYRRAALSDPTLIAAWLGEATALALAGREADAVARLGAGCAQLDNPPTLMFTLVRLLLGAADPAVRDADRAVELARSLLERQGTPGHGELLAVALAQAGQYGEAIRLQQRLLDAMPSGTDPQLEQRWRGQLDEWRRRIP